MVAGAAVLTADWFARHGLSAKAELRVMKTEVAITTVKLQRLIAWCSSIAQPFFEMWDFIVAQLIPGRGGLRV